MSMSAHQARPSAIPENEMASSDDVLAALRRAPVVPFTEEERALLAELALARFDEETGTIFVDRIYSTR